MRGGGVGGGGVQDKVTIIRLTPLFGWGALSKSVKGCGVTMTACYYLYGKNIEIVNA